MRARAWGIPNAKRAAQSIIAEDAFGYNWTSDGRETPLPLAVTARPPLRPAASGPHEAQERARDWDRREGTCETASLQRAEKWGYRAWRQKLFT